MVNAWLAVRPADVTTAVIATLIGTFLVWSGRRVVGWIAPLSDRWSLRWYRTELKRLQLLKADPTGLLRMLLHHAVWMLLWLGIAMMLSVFDFNASGAEFQHLIRLCIGSLIYFFGVHALGTYQSTRNLDGAIQRLEERIRKLENKRRPPPDR